MRQFEVHVEGVTLWGLFLWSQCVTGVISQSLQPKVQVTLANLGRCYRLGECAKLCDHISVCFCSQSGGDASTCLLM